MPSENFDIVIEDDETNTVFQFQKKLHKMKGLLRNVEDGRTFLLKNKQTTIGKEGNDINITAVQVERNHAVIEYDEQQDCFVIKDLSTTHGTYLNDCRIQKAIARLAHGDIVRFGHGAPRFEVALNIQNNPSVIGQQVWSDGYTSSSKSLPYLPLHATTSTDSVTKPYSTVSYGRYNGYHGHNRSTEIQNKVPRPPSRSRPVSANPANGVFMQSVTQRPLSASFGKGYTATYASVKPSEQVLELEAHVQNLTDELNRLSSLEDDSFRKDGIIATLRNEVDQLHKLLGEFDRGQFLSDEHISRVALLQSQLTVKDDEIRRLQDANRRLKNETLAMNRSTNQIADMKTHLSRHEQNILTMEHEIKKATQEKSQLSMLVNTLQKEVAAKDILIKKKNSETEQYKADLRNKDTELSSIAVKIASHESLKKSEKELKKKEEEIGNLKFRLRMTEDKLNKKITDFQTMECEAEKSENRLQNDLEMYRTRCKDFEFSDQQRKIDFQSLKRKYEKFHQNVAEFIGREGKKISSVFDDDDVLNYIHELKDDRDSAQQRLEEVLMEKIDLEKQLSSHVSLDNIRSLVSDIECRLHRNGRSCQNLDNELIYMRSFDVPDELNWLKDFVCSMLLQEYKWEQQIENALHSMIEESEKDFVDPAVLIQRLQNKLRSNLEKISDLETKINSAENQNTKAYKEMKDKIKEKYKRKTELALKELKLEEDLKHKEKIERLREKERAKLSDTLQAQKDLYENDIGSVKELSKKIESLKYQHRKAREEFQKLQRQLDESRRNETALEQKIKEQDMAYEIKEEILEKKLRDKESDEVLTFKNEIREYERNVSSLEKTLVDINREKKDLEFQLIDSRKSAKESTEKFKKEGSKANYKLKKEIENQNVIIQSLREQIEKTQNELHEEKIVSQSLHHDLDGLTAKLTDLKAEISEKEKRKLENIFERNRQLETELKEHRKQLLQMSHLVDEQKTKLIEQDKKIAHQNNTLAYQADGLRESQCDEKNEDRRKVKYLEHNWCSFATLWKQLKLYLLMNSRDARKFTTDVPATELMCLGEQCILQRHEQIISKQRAALSDLRVAVDQLESHPTVPTGQKSAFHEITNMKKENHPLVERLSVETNTFSKEEVIKQLYETKEILAKLVQDFQIEKKAHGNTQDALHDSEALYLRLMRLVSSELKIKDISCCKPMGYVDAVERNEIVNERCKAIEVMMNRLKFFRENLEKKDLLLESYDNDLRILRETELIAGIKSKEVQSLEIELQQNKDEIGYLREALKRCRNELDTQARMNQAFKNKKIFLMDYKEETEPKKHSCHIDELKTHKENEKKRKTKNLIEKKNFQMKDLKNELSIVDVELDEAKARLKEFQRHKDKRKYVDNSFLQEEIRKNKIDSLSNE